ncbi:TetR/AcrR family transcriptional regulator [Echinicola vietnamensis]|uniref:Transcriptional regulator n=1 Tax=Echinicola vietnamensis (strain DSM 17526 / LMG 23754 / KMM 6221) TaxID=926556 RepID=L0G582_ECHVK|nr:TetR/AcrR family transcriptional regulator [Echinicola vietnamensis]AGA80166.1 transcriptional regulator [Echinicola vietnamensis DSM 17526]
MKAQRNEEVELKILETANQLFLKNGFKHTTMDDISKKLGMSKKTVYQYFPGKQELLEASFNMLRTKLSMKVETILENEELSFLLKLKSMLSAIAKDLAPINPALLADMREQVPEVWAALEDYIRTSAYLRFQRLIQTGIDQGLVASHVDKSMVVLLYASAIQNLIDPKFLGQFPKEMVEGLKTNPAKIYDQAISIIFEGILTPEAREEYLRGKA